MESSTDSVTPQGANGWGNKSKIYRPDKKLPPEMFFTEFFYFAPPEVNSMEEHRWAKFKEKNILQTWIKTAKFGMEQTKNK